MHFDSGNVCSNCEIPMIKVNLMLTAHFQTNTSGYNLLTTRGTNISQNDTLSTTISFLFESVYSNYKNHEQKRIKFITQNIDSSIINYFQYKSTPLATSKNAFTDTFQISDLKYVELIHGRKFMNSEMATRREYETVQDRAGYLKYYITE